MAVASQVQNQPLPSGLPFRIISKTIGKGAYASIKKATPPHASTPVIAVKFINKEHALKVGRVKPKALQTEVSLHQHVGHHHNIIAFMASGEDQYWTWIAMELAEGDLFDKIEADVGVGEDIAHLYFSQLISAVSYMHSKGVAHRDIKPENMLLAEGDLKMADFGLATLYDYKGQKRPCTTVCGSPPYMAPEVVPEKGFNGNKTKPYEANKADVWSCGVVLFVLLVGNTPWDEPTRNSYEYNEYITQGTVDELWQRVPLGALALLKAMLRPDPAQRMSLEDVRLHPWFTRPNTYLHSNGRVANPLQVATTMLENLHINFDEDPMAPRYHSRSQDRMELDADDTPRLALTQPETPISDGPFDWEVPARAGASNGVAASQPTHGATTYGRDAPLSERYLEDPALSQFASTPSVPLTVTQAARRFKDIIPEASLARFLSFMDFPLLVPLICEAFMRLNVAAPNVSGVDLSGCQRYVLPVKTRDTRSCLLVGEVLVEQLEPGVLEVRFLKAKGDPLEWRRLFKKVAILCKDGILRPDM